MGRFRRSWELAKASWEVLQKDRELAWLPVISGVLSLVVIGVAAGLSFLIEPNLANSDADGSVNFAVWIIGILAVFALTITAVFFQAALVAGARERFEGRDPTVSSSINTATSRLHVIVPWALLATTVGLILRFISERMGMFGRIVSGLLDMAWNVLTFLVVPILVVEEKRPFDALRRSTELFRKTWGENLIGQGGLGILGLVLAIPAVIVAALFAAAGVAALTVVGIIIAVVWIALVAVVMSALTAIYQTALYEYATTGDVPVGYEGAGLDSAFAPRELGRGSNPPGTFGPTGGWS